MKNITFFKLLLALTATYGCICPMIRLPITTTNLAAIQAAKLAQYAPSYTQASASMVQIPQVQLNREQIDVLTSEITQNFKQPQVQPWTSFKAPSCGMFKTTQPMLMSWNYRQSPESILGLSNNPTEAELKAAHKKMAMKYHPDQGGSLEDFRKVQEAYEYLKYLSKIGREYSNKPYYQQTTQGQQYKQTHNYQQQTGKIHPRQEPPNGDWSFIGSWEKTNPIKSGLGFEDPVWTRILQDTDGFYWTEIAANELKYGKFFKNVNRINGFEYVAVPDIGWHKYNELYMARAYSNLGETKLKELLSISKNFKTIFLGYFVKILPVVALIPSIQKDLLEALKKNIENHFELLNIGRSNQAGKFDAYNINLSIEKKQELQEATEAMKKNLSVIYPNLKPLLDQHFKTIKNIEALNTILNRLENIDLSFSVNTAKRMENLMNSKVSVFGSNVRVDRFCTTLLTLRNLLLFFIGYKTVKFVQKKSADSQQNTTKKSTETTVTEDIKSDEKMIEFVDIKNPLEVEYPVAIDDSAIAI